jgi:hypothetical protein
MARTTLLINTERNHPIRHLMRLLPASLLGTYLLIVLVLVAIPRSSARAQDRLPEGTVVTFIVPTGTEIKLDDMVIFTGRSSGTIDATGCGGGEHHVQQVMIIDPGGGRATRTRVESIVLSQETPVRNGTRLTNLALVPPGSVTPSCAIGSTGYDKYSGTVE